MSDPRLHSMCACSVGTISIQRRPLPPHRLSAVRVSVVQSELGVVYTLQFPVHAAQSGDDGGEPPLQMVPVVGRGQRSPLSRSLPLSLLLLLRGFYAKRGDLVQIPSFRWMRFVACHWQPNHKCSTFRLDMDMSPLALALMVPSRPAAQPPSRPAAQPPSRPTSTTHCARA